MVLRDIHSPADLKRIPVDQLAPIVDQLRDYIIDTLSSHPGHLASSLGTVELAVALHYVFNTPDDKLVWDVGHQAYAHKILTGRGERFSTIRTYGGISGFPKMSESPYDAFGTGHSSTSISAALGMATASLLQGNTSRCHIAVIGDGALSGGEAFEALNNVGDSRANLLVVLNDNGISIDKAVGGMNTYLTRITASRRYNNLKRRVWNRLDGNDDDSKHASAIGFLQRLTSTAKTVAVGGSNLFEAIGIRYFGPMDGNNLVELIDILRRLKELEGPKLLHIVTKKGKGLRQAEQNPVIYHAPGLYDIRTGNQIKAEEADRPLKYQEVFGHTIIELAEKNPAIVGITPAMATGCSLNIMMEKMPDRVFDVGIAEQHAVTFSAGLAAEGMMPFCNIYSSFAQRAYDQIIHDVALQKLPVVICLDRAGLVGDDGPTHHGTFDLAYLRPIPNLTVCAPMNEHELRNMMYTAQLPNHGPVVIRYPRGASVHSNWQSDFCEIKIGEGRRLREGQDVAIVSLGHPGNDALAAAEELQANGISAAVYDMRFLKPMDTKLLDTIAASGYRRIVTIEDGCRLGGFGEAVLEYFAEHHPQIVDRITILAIPDEFITHGNVARLKSDCHIDKAAIVTACQTSR
ncbi:MAG: 1-deoxy-D-xylulose-5-phosphate synthase [Bacteroidales bacterium]|nr:1-deoxy-D-xylulose-5-phosphate synthase [Bacteroidales bacterium]